MKRDLTPEERAAHGAAIKAGWARMSPERLEAFRASCRAAKARRRERLAAAAAAGVAAPARAVKGSRDARVVAGNDGCAMPTTLLGAAVRAAQAQCERTAAIMVEAALEVHKSVMPCDVVRTGPPRPEWLPTHGAPADAHRTNGDLGRGVAHLIEGIAERSAEAIVPRLQGVVGQQGGTADPLRPRLIALARLAVAMAHTSVKGGVWLDATSAVSRAALDLEAALAREPRS